MSTYQELTNTLVATIENSRKGKPLLLAKAKVIDKYLILDLLFY
jgi:hypothetical protein